LEIIANDKDTDEEVDLPYVRFRFRWTWLESSVLQPCKAGQLIATFHNF
jgi:hypothetical protein